MRTDIAPIPTRLADYIAPNFAIKSVFLDIALAPQTTRVKSQLHIQRQQAEPFSLDGEDIDLIRVQIDGEILDPEAYQQTHTQLIIYTTKTAFTLEIETQCAPKNNHSLMGLYMSGGRYYTQCEAEGFRRITFYPDRPDVLSIFTVKITAPTSYPFLLSNGNRIESGSAGPDHHYAIWHDPFAKPCYLFALVAGEFDVLKDQFITMHQRQVALYIYVDPGHTSQATYAMDSLKRAMRWDEQKFGREYDLDRFMIVAVRDFNFGAMENKGLNIFNSALLLADPQTATDMDYEQIEAVIAHEYFHNWSGNRITCRDWFQLCLKEGFTVFRDQEFSADQRGFATQRIKTVRALRARQFPEDAGPLAHPVRPDQYIKIDNFYTATIYEKGAELIRMLKTLIGSDMFRKGCDHYFTHLDGTAATIEQFIACFETVSGQDLSPFLLWYEQAGTPHLHVTRQTHETGLHLKLEQKTTNHPQIIPVKWQLIGDQGAVTQTQLTIMDTSVMHLDIDTPTQDVSLSLLQDFSAPVIVHSDNSPADELRLMAADPNPFNRWEAGQAFARRLIITAVHDFQSKSASENKLRTDSYVQAIERTLDDKTFDNAFKALTLLLPTHMEMLQYFETSDPIAVEDALSHLYDILGTTLREKLDSLYSQLSTPTPFLLDTQAAGHRALRGRVLHLLAMSKAPQAHTLASAQLRQANNMTDELNALHAITKIPGPEITTSLQAFYDKWQNHPLVIDKWFALNARRADIDIHHLLQHPAYQPQNPNRVRAILSTFAYHNPKLFHHPDGSGYALLADQILVQDKLNPQVAARLAVHFEIWRKLDRPRQKQISNLLEKIIAAQPSKNLLEIAIKTKDDNKI